MQRGSIHSAGGEHGNGASSAEQQIIDISHNTPTETVYLPITEYFSD